MDYYTASTANWLISRNAPLTMYGETLIMANASPLLSSMRAESWDGPDLLVRMPKEMEDNKMALLGFLSGSPEKIEDHFGEYLPIVGFIAKRAVFNADKDKPARVGFYLGIVLEDGCILQSTSEVIANAIDSYRSILGEFPQAEPLWVKLEKVKARAGFSYRFTPVASDKVPTDAKVYGALEE